MSILKDKLVNPFIADFWQWFQKNENFFFQVIKNQGDIEEDFFNKLSPELDKIAEGFYFLTGMCDDNTVELVFTAEGRVKNIVFMEDIVQSAPKIEGWLFTALKPALDIRDVNIRMGDYDFNAQNINFYAQEHPDFPDEIDIVVVHDDFNEKNKSLITNGVYIFLDNFLGELNFATNIDALDVIDRKKAEAELIPIEKLKAYLIWREKEFIEKYEGTLQNTQEANYVMFEAESENEMPLLAVINADLLAWGGKASHPWIFTN